MPLRHALVLPNLASFRSRGRMAERWEAAKQLGCDAVEVPADLIKSSAEVERTGQPIGSVLTRNSVDMLYGAPHPEARTILHTDPAIPRRERGGRVIIPELRWDDPEWRGRYAESVGLIARSVGGVVAVEVHPGIEVGGFEGLAEGFMDFEAVMSSAMGSEPLILIENKYRQRMASVEDMTAVMALLPHEGRFGLVVDISNLWKTYRSRTSRAMADLPWERVKALHLHFKHRAPRADDPVDWELLLQLVMDHPGRLYLNPEVFHRSELELALRTIRNSLSS